MVDLLPTAEQQELTNSIARFLASDFPVHRLAVSGLDPAREPQRWSALADLGWFGIGVPEQSGGTGLRLVEQALVLREFGRVLAPLQVLGAVAGARVAALADETEIAAEVASGAMRLAVMVPSGPIGEVYLIDDDGADLALLVTPTAASLFAMEDLQGCLKLSPFDSSLTLSRTTTRDLTPRCILEGAKLHDEVLVLSAAYCAGICEAVCAMASEYAKTREQFGQAIGAFQAVKHRCADMAIRADAAWSQVVFAALAAGEDRADGNYQALSANIVATTYAIDSAQENIQLHGAIGITEELPAHRYLKRARMMDMCFGSSCHQKVALLGCADLQEVMP